MEIMVGGQIIDIPEEEIANLDEYKYSDHLYRKARLSNIGLCGVNLSYGVNIDIYVKNDCLAYIAVFKYQLIKDLSSLSIVEELLATNDPSNYRIAKEILDKMDKELDIK